MKNTFVSHQQNRRGNTARVGAFAMAMLLLALSSSSSALPSFSSFMAEATNCGEPRLSATDTCTNWQCSRIIYPTPIVAGSSSSSALSAVSPSEDTNGTYFGFGLCVRGLGEGAACTVDDDCFVKKYVCRKVAKVNGTQYIHDGQSRGDSSSSSADADLDADSSSYQCVKAAEDKVAWQGYLAVAISVVGFGTNFVPAKQVRSGNGILFQLAQCLGVIVAGIITALVTQKFTLYPMSLVGGLLWTLGNCLCVPIIQLVGLGIGLSVWGTTNMLVGWASGRFGFMGVEEEIAPTPWRSYVGVSVAILAICAFAAVKPTTGEARVRKGEKGGEDGERDGLLNANTSLDTLPVNNTNAVHVYASDEAVRRAQQEQEEKATKDAPKRRVLGLVMGVVAGIFFGLNFNPSQAMMDHYDQRTLEDGSSTPSIYFSPVGVDYFFSFAVGTIMSSILISVLFYAAHTILPSSVQKLVVPTLFDDMHLIDFGKMLVPGFISGLIWSCAQIGWFVANTNLGLSVTFPLIGVGPAVVANAWGIFLFKEVQGRRNFILLGLAFFLVGISCGFTVWAQSE